MADIKTDTGEINTNTVKIAEPPVKKNTSSSSSTSSDRGSNSDQSERQAVSETDPSQEKPLSKRQQRRQAKKEVWESLRQERRKEERQRRQKRRQDAIASGEPFTTRKRIRPDPNRESKCKVTVAIDMSFDDLMSDKDIKRGLTQMQYCYSANRRAANPMQFYVTSFDGKSRHEFDRTRGCVNWDEKCIRLKTEDYLNVFDKDKIVYLTSESPNVLEKLDDDEVYVIGGLVDHNTHKGLSHRLAEEKGIKHARLPIDEYVVMKTRKVLTINHVFEIMLKFTELGDWEKAFFDVIPKRKEVAKKS